MNSTIEQHRIAAELDALQAEVDALKRLKAEIATIRNKPKKAQL